MNKISRIGTAASDPTTGKIIILDSSSKAEKIEALLFELANLKAHRKSNELKRNICQYTSEEFVYEVESIEFESNRLVNSIIDSCRKIEGFDVKALLRFSSLEEAISYLQKVGHTNHYVDYHHHNCN